MNPETLPNSLWAATAIPPPETPPLTDEIQADVAIVGGGFLGLSTALHLAEQGTQVVLLEANEPGWGASGRNGGQVIPGLKYDREELTAHYGEQKGERLYVASGEFADTVFELIRRHNIDCEAQQCGWLNAFTSDRSLPTLERRAAHWQQRGAPIELLDASTTEQLIGTRLYRGSYLDKRGGRLQPLSFARGLCTAALKAGAVVHGGSAVTQIKKTGSHWSVSTDQGAVNAESVVLCTNAYTDLGGHGGPWQGLSQSIIPLNSFQIATKPLSDKLRQTILPEGHVCSDLRRLLSYCRLEADGRLIMGARGGSGNGTLATEFKHVIATMNELFPQLGEIKLDYYWSGRVALTLDNVPHVHRLAPGVFAALGLNGRGVAQATSIGKYLAAYLTGPQDDDFLFPITPMPKVPFHKFLFPAIQVATVWKRLLDYKDKWLG